MNENQSTTIVIISSSDLRVTGDLQSQVISALTFIPEGSEIRIRKRDTSHVEHWIWTMREAMDIHDRSWVCTEWVTREGGSNYKRDRQMVDGADLVLAFFTEARFMDGGTGHAVTSAIEAEVPVEAWVSHDDGTLSLVAEYDSGSLKPSQQWLSSRNVADMVLEFQAKAMGSLVSSPQFRKRNGKSTPTGSPSTKRTGKAKSHSGSIFRVASD
jgi:hypothetical protein